MTRSLNDVQADVLVLGALGRLARHGLLDRPAPVADSVAAACQRLLIAAGLLAPDPVRPTESLAAVLPPGVPLGTLGGYVTATLRLATELSTGATTWSPDEPEVIRFFGQVSGVAVTRVLAQLLTDVPGFPDRLDRPGAAFLDIGAGAAGISIELCRRHPGLAAVGLDINPLAVRVARDAVTNAGLDDRIEVREQSVTDVDENDAYDLIWVPQPFLPPAVLAAALPRLHRSARPGAILVMGLAAAPGDAVPGAAADVEYLLLGGGGMAPADATDLLTGAGFVDVRAVTRFPAPLMVARRAGQD
ncbi:class I SAM-dependent methyltransferase [Micromonospora chersina]|uniref:class I SAM-dependent methyltransferase n=1 Tax=Micromonospora chersina TaxID=47854 RepID=UPI0033BFA7B7